MSGSARVLECTLAAQAGCLRYVLCLCPLSCSGGRRGLRWPPGGILPRSPILLQRPCTGKKQNPPLSVGTGRKDGDNSALSAPPDRMNYASPPTRIWLNVARHRTTTQQSAYNTRVMISPPTRSVSGGRARSPNRGRRS